MGAPGAPWTADNDTELRRLCDEGLSCDAIVAAIGRSEYAVRNRCRDLDIEPRSRRWKDSRAADFEQAVRDGVQADELAPRFNMSRHACLRRISLIGLTKPHWLRPVNPPPEFAELALTTKRTDLAARYQLSENVIRRWIDAQSPEWRAMRIESLRVIQTDATASKRASTKRPVKRRVNLKVIQAEQRRIELENHLAMPADFPTVCIGKRNGELVAHYATTGRRVKTWLAALDPSIRTLRTKRFGERQAVLLREHWERERLANPPMSRSQKRAAKKIGKKPGGSVMPVNWGFAKPIETAALPDTIARRAADFLKRPPHRFCNVYDAALVRGKRYKGLWCCGAMGLVSEAVLIETAVNRGFSA